MVLRVKVLVILAANSLSDEQAEFLINDWLSFMRFLGLLLGERVPDARTIWLFRERLTRAEIESGLRNFVQQFGMQLAAFQVPQTWTGTGTKTSAFQPGRADIPTA